MRVTASTAPGQKTWGRRRVAAVTVDDPEAEHAIPGARPDPDQPTRGARTPIIEDERGVVPPAPAAASRSPRRRARKLRIRTRQHARSRRRRSLPRSSTCREPATRTPCGMPASCACAARRISFTIRPIPASSMRCCVVARAAARGRRPATSIDRRRCPASAPRRPSRSVRLIVDSRITPPRSMRCTMASTSMAAAMSSTGICSTTRTKSICAMTFSVTCCTITGIRRGRLRLVAVLFAPRDVVEVPQPVLRAVATSAASTAGRLTVLATAAERAATTSITAAARRSASIARPTTAPGKQRHDPGLGVGGVPVGIGDLGEGGAGGTPGEADRTRPRRAPRRSTSVTPGGGAGTGVPRGRRSSGFRRAFVLPAVTSTPHLPATVGRARCRYPPASCVGRSCSLLSCSHSDSSCSERCLHQRPISPRPGPAGRRAQRARGLSRPRLRQRRVSDGSASSPWGFVHLHGAVAGHLPRGRRQTDRRQRRHRAVDCSRR